MCPVVLWGNNKKNNNIFLANVKITYCLFPGYVRVSWSNDIVPNRGEVGQPSGFKFVISHTLKALTSTAIVVNMSPATTGLTEDPQQVGGQINTDTRALSNKMLTC